MSTEEFYLYGHLLGVFLLLGAAGLSTGAGIAVGRVTHAKTVLTLCNTIRYSELFGTSAGAILSIVFGSLLISEAGYSFGDPWVSAAYALFVVVLGIDHGFLMPRNNKARAMAAALGDAPVSVDLVQHLTNPLTTAAGVLLDISFLVFLYLMIAKPGA
ncbi:DUF2269 family protein [Candidatus Amarobacter glycogenicus]|uniref:DUF2269 family protein n=1 Tax=Candidatus Amarobacter glycogenicus TaxID=3140699 RepID=UPI002A0BE0C9|nr:DUF2269 family protein [Dehalococcoidia bacterium]